MRIFKLFVFTGLVFGLFACNKDLDEVTLSKRGKLEFAVNNNVILEEDFEGASKSAYATGSIVLGAGSWTLNDALIGTTSSDAKNGLKSIRARNTGRITMNFDYVYGAATVTVNHAVYGTDGSSTWELYYSTNGGISWSKVENTITTSLKTFQNKSFNINVSGNIRFEIRKISGGTNRINIDDFIIKANGQGGGGSGGGSGTDGDHLAFGNPSGATAIISNENNFLMKRTHFSISYNRSKASLNWVSWYVNSTSIGSVARQNDFRGDISLPTGWYQVSSSSFSGSGFDRGHGCPSGDRTSSVEANSATFLMTNMIPQAPNNNQRTWANLENYCRTMVNSGNEVYIIMGSYGNGGTGSNGYAATVDNGRVVVPKRIWKVIVVLPNGDNDVARVTSSTRIIAVDTPNDNSVSATWSSYRTSVDAIEQATGYDLLSNITDNVEAIVEGTVDNSVIN